MGDGANQVGPGNQDTPQVYTFGVSWTKRTRNRHTPSAFCVDTGPLMESQHPGTRRAHTYTREPGNRGEPGNQAEPGNRVEPGNQAEPGDQDTPQVYTFGVSGTKRTRNRHTPSAFCVDTGPLMESQHPGTRRAHTPTRPDTDTHPARQQTPTRPDQQHPHRPHTAQQGQQKRPTIA